MINLCIGMEVVHQDGMKGRILRADKNRVGYFEVMYLDGVYSTCDAQLLQELTAVRRINIVRPYGGLICTEYSRRVDSR